ncbi:hypothetical protein HPB49_019389 [Dermacentor silvarum]|uniref:Uncharacterized protein n=1 Tax=Dermacentor silvarum TaxID=543639 RepID=A0ACB8CAU3_DERSI|nr:hypothetical protein HPB49_019389 [Dermacentor silvarum]
MLRASQQTKASFSGYFEAGLGPAEAIQHHEALLAAKPDGPLQLANGRINPLRRTVYWWHSEWRISRFGLPGNPLAKLQEKVAKYAAAAPSALSKRDGTSHYGQVLLTATSRDNCSQTTEGYRAAFQLLKDKHPSCFANKEAPVAFMTDNSRAEKDGLCDVWPSVTQLLCIFHVLQAEWRWLLAAHNKIAIDDRRHLMGSFQKVGMWELRAEPTTKTDQPVIGLVYARPAAKETPILLDVWISGHSSAVRYYATLALQYMRYHFVGVHPDITQNDGVYSRYFTDFTSTGRYDLTVVANDNDVSAVVVGASSAEFESRFPEGAEYPSCCGSRVPDSYSQKTSRFTRINHYGSFFVTVPKPDRDVLPPSRITDLRVVATDNRRMAVTFNWTAPGDDFDEGQASRYELKSFKDRLNAQRRFASHGQLVGQWDVDGPYYEPPKPFGTTQTATVRLKNGQPTSTPLYFAIRAVDDQGNAGPVSNVVEVVIIPPPTTTSTSTQPSSSWGNGSGTAGGAGAHGQPSGSRSTRDKLNAAQLALIIAVPLAVLLVGIIVIILLMARRRKAPPPKKSTDNGSASQPPPLPAKIARDDLTTTTTVPPQQTTPIMDDDIKQTTPTSGRLDATAISPVNSWPASVLLDHYNKVQQAKQRHEPPPIMMVEDGVSLNSSTPSLYSKSDYGGVPAPARLAKHRPGQDGVAPPLPPQVPSYNAVYTSSQHSLDKTGGVTRNITQV